MSIRIAIANKLKFKVKGTFKDESGADVPFDFGLTAQRLDAEQLAAKFRDEGDASIGSFVKSVVEDWSGVLDADRQPVPFSPDALESLLKLPGIALLVYRTYQVENGAKEKN